MTSSATRFVLVPALAAGLVLAGAVVRAQAADASSVPEQIRLMLAAEDWVTAETAEVGVEAQLTLVKQDPATVRHEVTAALGRIDKASWRIVRFQRGTDAAGATRWTIRAEARLPQADLDGLAARARGQSGAGRTFRVAGIDTTPSLAEREAVLRTLRGHIYAMARKEIAVARGLWPGRTVTIARVDFLETPMTGPRPGASMARLQSSVVGGSADATTTQEKLTLRAWVTLVPAPAPAH